MQLSTTCQEWKHAGGRTADTGSNSTHSKITAQAPNFTVLVENHARALKPSPHAMLSITGPLQNQWHLQAVLMFASVKRAQRDTSCRAWTSRPSALLLLWQTGVQLPAAAQHCFVANYLTNAAAAANAAAHCHKHRKLLLAAAAASCCSIANCKSASSQQRCTPCMTITRCSARP
jgi:hypothetical protein